jgi:hypothetical protein
MKDEKDFESYIDEAISNIRQDRAMAAKLLTDLVQFMNKQNDHESLGLTASKYLETLQRSNEQLAKIIATIGKHQSTAPQISEAEIYDMIKADKEDGE